MIFIYYIIYMKDFTKLSADEEKTINEAQEMLKSIPLIPCTTCNTELVTPTIRKTFPKNAKKFKNYLPKMRKWQINLTKL